MDDDQKMTLKECQAAVTMTPKELKKWLATDESNSVGLKSDAGGEATGYDPLE